MEENSDFERQLAAGLSGLADRAGGGSARRAVLVEAARRERRRKTRSSLLLMAACLAAIGLLPLWYFVNLPAAPNGGEVSPALAAPLAQPPAAPSWNTVESDYSVDLDQGYLLLDENLPVRAVRRVSVHSVESFDPRRQIRVRYDAPVQQVSFEPLELH